MNNAKHILLLVALLLGRVGVGCAQDNARMSDHTIMGTARYVGMSGAMTAIGGDPSAALDNPAGLGLYRRSEVLLTGDFSFDRTSQSLATGAEKRNIAMIPQASWVISLMTSNPTEVGAQYHNFMFSFHRLHSFYRNMYATAEGEASLGALFASTGVDMGIDYCADRTALSNELLLQESGYIHDYGIDWAMNISNRWYVGAGLHVQSYNLTADATYKEVFPTINADGLNYANRNVTYLHYRGSGANGSLGVLYRPLNWLRLGFSLQTPSIATLTINSDGTFTGRTDSVRSSEAPYLTGKDKFSAPLHTSTSVAFQLGTLGMLALQYDYRHTLYQEHYHSMRVGLEIIPVMGLYLNAGYAYESTFGSQSNIVNIDPTLERQDAYYQVPKYSQYASVALGYRGEFIIVQAAYQFRWQAMQLYAHQNATPYSLESQTHRIVLTLGWHRRN